MFTCARVHVMENHDLIFTVGALTWHLNGWDKEPDAAGSVFIRLEPASSCCGSTQSRFGVRESGCVRCADLYAMNIGLDVTGPRSRHARYLQNHYDQHGDPLQATLDAAFAYDALSVVCEVIRDAPVHPPQHRRDHVVATLNSTFGATVKA